MKNKNIRWIQHLINYHYTLQRLGEAIKIIAVIDENNYIDELLKEGLIQRYKHTRESTWELMTNYAEYQGYTDISGAHDAIRKMVELEIIEDKEWIGMIEDHNRTSHTYNSNIVEEIYTHIVNIYYPLLVKFESKIIKISSLL